MANKFWVGGGSSTNWTATGNTNWSTTSGGANNAAVPVDGVDSIFFNASSGSGTSAIDASWVNSPIGVDFTGFTGTLAGSTDLFVTSASSFAFKFGSGMTQSWTGNLVIGDLSAGNCALTSAGKSFLGNISCASLYAATVTLQDAIIVVGSFSPLGNRNTGTEAFDANGFSITAGTFSTNNASLFGRTVTLGGPVTLTGSGTVWLANSTNLTFNKGSANIKMTGAGAKTFAGGGLTYNNVWHSAGSDTGKLTVTGANTYADFKDDGSAAHTIQFPASTTQTMTTFTMSGHAGQLISLVSDSSGTAATLSQASGTVNSDYLSIKDSAATGGATWNAGSHSTNVSGNSGWIFPSVGALLRPSAMEGLGGGYRRDPMASI